MTSSCICHRERPRKTKAPDVRILLAAYDFPPIPSPQSLRWAYLVRELAHLGHEVHVLAPDVAGYGPGGLPDLPETVKVHRVYPGPFSAFLRNRSRKIMASMAPPPASSPAVTASIKRAEAASQMQAAAKPPSVDATVGRKAGHEFHELNWKGRLRYRIERFSLPRVSWHPSRHRATIQLGSAIERCKALLSYFLFPDYRAEWLPWADRRLRKLLPELQPDWVVTSHEPACSLPLGLRAKQLGYRWVADLGDPVLAPYTPPHWQKRAHAIERAVCVRADLVSVTSVAAAETLQARHGLPIERSLLLTQGFDAAFRMPPKAEDDGLVVFDPAKLELLYTGSFYDFRKLGHLLQAVVDIPGARLNVATIAAPSELLRMVDSYPESFRLLGFLSHRRALEMQRGCDVLVNLANENPVQVPGKLYEYLGAGVPVLHVGGKADDAASGLLAITGVGVCERDDYVAIRNRLQQWMAEKSLNGHLQLPRNGNHDLSAHSWQALAKRFVDALTRSCVA